MAKRRTRAESAAIVRAAAPLLHAPAPHPPEAPSPRETAAQRRHRREMALWSLAERLAGEEDLGLALAGAAAGAAAHVPWDLEVELVSWSDLFATTIGPSTRGGPAGSVDVYISWRVLRVRLWLHAVVRPRYGCGLDVQGGAGIAGTFSLKGPLVPDLYKIERNLPDETLLYAGTFSPGTVPGLRDLAARVIRARWYPLLAPLYALYGAGIGALGAYLARMAANAASGAAKTAIAAVDAAVPG